MKTYAAWIGKQQYREELLTSSHIEGLNALLDQTEGQPLGLQWLLCQDRELQSLLGPDGHPRRGAFLPPVELPRRMWAAGDIQFQGTVLPGQRIERSSRVSDIKCKQGRSGDLVFVAVDHSFAANGEPWLDERHTIVYRGDRREGPEGHSRTPVNPEDYQWMERVATDTTQLFRYSALTFNGHRIHYDQRYVTEVEGYPGLVVHGPLMATWLMNFADRQSASLTLDRFSFRVHAPVFVGETITLLGRPSELGFELAVADDSGQRIISATSTLKPR
jgi:3-methylfumaryl-CoA hydratase